MPDSWYMGGNNESICFKGRRKMGRCSKSNNVRMHGWGTGNDMEDFFDEITLGDVILEEQKPINDDIEFEIIKINNEYYKIVKLDKNGKIVAEVKLGNNELIKNVKDFNEKCSLLFGFVLEEKK